MKAKLIKEGFATEEGRKIDTICRWLGYDDFHEFIGDNPGCYEAIIQWIDEYFADQLAEEYMDPAELDKVGLIQAAEQSREYQNDEE